MRLPSRCSTVRAPLVAYACLAILVSASATKKYYEERYALDLIGDRAGSAVILRSSAGCSAAVNAIGPWTG
jgi:hypothetical protein